MSLRKLKIEIDLGPESTGQAAREAHQHALAAVCSLLEAKGWGGFSIQLHTNDGRRIGYARLDNGPLPSFQENDNGDG